MGNSQQPIFDGSDQLPVILNQPLVSSELLELLGTGNWLLLT